jgi:mono/diheme cytochrome c family protein
VNKTKNLLKIPTINFTMKDGRLMLKEKFSGAPLVFLGAALILTGWLLSQSGVALAAPPLQAPDTPPSAAGGRALWTENCQPCHGSTGQGDGPTAASIPNPLPNLSAAETGRQSVPADYFDIIKNGRMDRMMPPWGNRLSDAEIWDTVAYVWSLSTDSQDLAAGETIYQNQCAECHGENGQGAAPEVQANQVDFSDLSAMTQQSQINLQAAFGSASPHNELANDLSDEELWQVLDYVRTFSFQVAAPQGNGILTGQIINGTTGKPVANVPVTLHVFQGNSEIDTLIAEADSSGRYTFENLLTEHSILYLVEGIYQDVSYVSPDPGIFAPDSSETTLDLMVYEPTTDAGTVKITQLHYLLAFTPNAINAVQIFVMGNEGDQTYVGDGETLTFTVPEGATDVAFQNDPTGTRFVQTGEGYADTAPIVPGEEGSSIVVSYNIPYDSDTLAIDLPLPADTADLNVLMSAQGATLSSDQVEFVETRQVQGGEFSIFNGGSLVKGDTLSLNLSGLNDLDFGTAAAAAPGGMGGMVATPPVDQNMIRWVVLGLGGLAIVGAGLAYPLFRPQLTHQTSVQTDEPDLHRQKLLLMLARLDEAFEAGELDKEVYQQARTKYKTELAQVME